MIDLLKCIKAERKDRRKGNEGPRCVIEVLECIKSRKKDEREGYRGRKNESEE